MKKRKVTLDTIANRLGVTKVTISKALNNQPGVSAELKKRIVQTSLELGYTTKTATKMANTVSKLGFLVPKRFFLDTDNFYTRIYYYMNQECAQRNISISLYILNPEQEGNFSVPLSLDKDQSELNGLFIVGELSEEYIRMLSSFPLPIIAIDFYKTDLPFDCILSDNYQSGYLVTKHLIDKGHVHIGFVGDPHYTSSVMDRYCGYLKALTTYNIELNKDWHIINNDANGSYLIDFSLPKELPTAYVCHCDMAAYKLLIKLQSEGITVPDQVSIISFDNTDLSQTLVPALSSVNISKHDFATEAVSLMLWRLKHSKEQHKYTYLKSSLIHRDSVRKLN